MAMLASKSPYPPAMSGGKSMLARTFTESSQMTQITSAGLQDGFFASPTTSEFSEMGSGLDAVRAWDERKVGEWLHSIRCGQYDSLFRANNVTGDSLLECDQKILSEMGIKKIGDRVRINVAIKQLRNKASLMRSRKNRDSMAALDGLATPSSADLQRLPSSRLANRRLESNLKSTSRPSSPLPDIHVSALRNQRYGGSPLESGKRELSGGYFNPPSSAATTTGRRSETTPNLMHSPSGKHSHQHLRQNSSIDGLTPGGLPSNSPVIKIVHNSGQTKVVNVKFCKSADEVTMTVLKKLLIPEKQFRNYCFFVLSGLEAEPQNCRRLGDGELMDICSDANRSERNRLILRRVIDGYPDVEEVRKAAKLAMDESQAIHSNAINSSNMRNQIKLQQLTGESWHNMQVPLSPARTNDRHYDSLATADEDEDEDEDIPQTARLDGPRNSKLRSFYGARPPSEMIVSELTSYFPGHQREEIERTMRMSMRRSQRMSRAASRLSVMSNFSMASSLRDAPPVPQIPSIADAWLTKPGEAGIGAKPRPLSISTRFVNSMYRDSVASSMLEPLQEESPLEGNRKSYVSFDSTPNSAIESAGPGPRASFFDENPATPLTPMADNMNERLSVIIGEDGEEEDPALNDFLAGNSFDKKNWMKGDLIGEGSFGSVYLALHAITGELMAVKQVELPDMANEGDKKKESMISALEQEISLLQGLHHEHIVQYLGTSSDEGHLNIFLEYVPGGSIAGMLKQYTSFPEPLMRNFTRQVLEGLAYLHARNIIHRDIKGANILVDNRGAVKISDFGVSKQTSKLANSSGGGGPGNRTSLQGSVFWMAPEVVRQSGQTIKSDIWSLGCLIVEMFTGNRPFPDMTTLQTLFAVGSQSVKPQIPEHASEAAKRFMNLCFEIDHTKRPTAEELLHEPFLLPMA